MSENTSGFIPYDDGILVRVEPPKEKTTKAGLILTSKAEAPSVEAVQNGVLVGMGSTAFADCGEDKPKIGDKVFFTRYAGQMIYSFQSEDELTYRVMYDTDIKLIKEEKNDR